MGWLQDFTGTSQKRDITQAKGRADAALDAGLEKARGYYDEAGNYFAPYAESGKQANELYSRAIGLRGQPEAAAVASEFKDSNPFRQENADFADKQLLSKFNAMGAVDSGASRLAVARANLERGSVDWNQWLDRIQGKDTQGVQVAGGQAGIATGAGDLEYGAGATKAGTEISYGNAMAASRNTLTNNLLNAAGVAVKAFAPSPYPTPKR